jgi:hypothetical protein
MRIRRRYAIVLALTAAGALAVAGIAMAAADGNNSSMTSSFSPSKVPKKKFKPGKLKTDLITHFANPANVGAGGFGVRTQIFIDDDFKINPGAVKVCNQNLNGLNMAAAMAACSKAKVGSGTAHAFPNLPNCVLLFNGPKKGGKSTLTVFTRIGTSTCGDPAHNTSGAGSFTLSGVLKNASGDFGKILDVNPVYPSAPSPLDDFKTTIGRGSYFSGRCHDGNKTWNLKTKWTYSDGQTDTATTKQKCKVKH